MLTPRLYSERTHDENRASGGVNPPVALRANPRRKRGERGVLTPRLRSERTHDENGASGGGATPPFEHRGVNPPPLASYRGGSHPRSP
jgi:hypothetical protein